MKQGALELARRLAHQTRITIQCFPDIKTEQLPTLTGGVCLLSAMMLGIKEVRRYENAHTLAKIVAGESFNSTSDPELLLEVAEEASRDLGMEDQMAYFLRQNVTLLKMIQAGQNVREDNIRFLRYFLVKVEEILEARQISA